MRNFFFEVCNYVVVRFVVRFVVEREVLGLGRY